ncbi:N-acetyltransferase family protein [Planococcus sp. SSTMD024]|uniref:GNAT family N-acetyltransferase n=1 Tax=Planococcus sp. SSTMD024 TaxID=3242163 RepID=UPI00351DBCE7
MIIRKAKQSELKKIISLSPQAIYDGTLGEVMPSGEKVKSLVNPLLDKGGFYFVAVEEGEILGWILVGTIKDQFTEQPIGFIYEIYIQKEQRGHGHSKSLINVAIDHFQQEGYSEVRLSAKAENPAVKLYENIGFTTRTVSMSLNLK